MDSTVRIHCIGEGRLYRTGAAGAEYEDGGEARVAGLADVAGSQAASVLGYCTHGLPAETDNEPTAGLGLAASEGEAEENDESCGHGGLGGSGAALPSPPVFILHQVAAGGGRQSPP